MGNSKLQVISVMNLTPDTETLTRDMRNAKENVQFGEEVILDNDGYQRHAFVERIEGSMVFFRMKD